MSHIQKLTVKGYKSIKALVDFELRPLNVLIGANDTTAYFNDDWTSFQSTSRRGK